MPASPIPSAGVPATSSRLHRTLTGFLLSTFLVPTLAWGQSDAYGLHEKSVERVTEAQKTVALGMDAFGDQISHFDGGLSFSVTDVSAQGNHGLPVEVRRSFAIQDRREFTSGPSTKGYLGGFGEWNLDIPHLSGTFKASVGWKVAGSFPLNRCSETNPPIDYHTIAAYDYWSGYHLNLPGGGSESLLHTPSSKLPAPGNGTHYPWITRSLWRISCKPGTKNGYPGQAFLATAPDGTKYHFDYVVTRQAPSLTVGGYDSRYPVQNTMQREVVFFLVSRVEDRLGNTVDYTYTGDKLTRIESSDGRYINLAWSGANIVSVSSPLGTWSYSYANGSLTTVTRPDASQWKYQRTGRLFLRTGPAVGQDDVEFDECSELNPVQSPSCEYGNQIPIDQQEGDIFADCPEGEFPIGDTVVYSVTHPAGAKAVFTLGPGRNYRSNVQHHCIKPSPSYEYLQVPNYSDGFVLHSKSVSGPGLDMATWTYELTGGHGLAFASVCSTPGSIACPLSRSMEVTGPGQTWERYEYGIVYGVNEGQLLKHQSGSSAANILQTVDSQYLTAWQVGDQSFPDLIGLNPQPYADKLADSMRPLKQRTTARQGNNFVWRADYFDAFGRTTAITRQTNQSVPIKTRAETTVYYDRLGEWALGQVAERRIAGAEVERTQFNAQGLPWKLHAHGALVQTLTYNADGTVATVTDALGNTTTLANWYRGIPRRVTFADTTVQEATVDARGWVTSTTNEAGATTSYAYDSMGRVSQVTHPGGDAVAWTPTTVSFVKGTASAFGLPAGHWKQTTTTGSYRKEVYLDALWRPVLEREWQLNNATPTMRYKGWKYDHAGRVTFTGYPRASASSIASFADGVTTRYDALGRVTRIEQDSEIGDLVTTTAYLPGLATRVTNPRGHITLTTSRAFDDPDAATPYKIQAPGGVTTDIALDVFGKPTALTRTGSYAGQTVSATRRYVYDDQHRLCKRVEPETGAAFFAYDAAGNLAWSAEGQSLTGLSCDRNAVAVNQRTLRSYDSRNRLTLVDHPDSTPDVATTYTADGKVATIARAPTLWTYTYNNRGLLTGERMQWGAINSYTAYTHTALGHVASMLYPSGNVVWFHPNSLGQPTQAGTYATNATYHPNGALASFKYGNDIVHTMTQNLRQLPDISRDALGGNVVLDDRYNYDANGNVLAVSDGLPGQPGNRDMSYDALNRLVGVNAGQAHGGVMAAAYDPLDNLRSLDQGPRQFRYNYDASNRLSTIKSPGGATLHSFGYDARGNTTSKDGQALTFDRENRLVNSNLPHYASYVYDGLGRRVREWTGGFSQYFIYSQAGQLIHTNDMKEAAWFDHIYLSGSLVATRKMPHTPTGVVITYQHTDALGTPVVFTNENAQVVDDGRTTPWGEPADGQWVNRPGYTGHQMDAVSKLVYMQQRYYDPAIGRFLSVDPVATSPSSGDLFNRYNYAHNNPYTFLDPDGRMPNKAGATDSTVIASELEGTTNLWSHSETYNRFERRYFYTEKFGWVDAKHFFAAAHLERAWRFDGVARAAGVMVELEQKFWAESTSAFSPEDLPSNEAGIDFGNSIRKGESLETAFTRWSELNGGMTGGTFKESPEYQSLPDSEPVGPGVDSLSSSPNSNSTKEPVRKRESGRN